MDNKEKIKKICPQCGRVFMISKGRGEKYCSKHRHQLTNYGHFLDSNPRSKNDPNEYTVKGNVTEVCTYDKAGNPKYTFMIDTEDIMTVLKYKWAYREKENGVYIVNDSVGYLHNLLLPHGKGITVDHIDRNPLNNCKGNLRYATQNQQNYNQKKKDSKFDIKGIYTTNTGRFIGYMNLHSKRYLSPAYPYYEQAVYARYLLEQLSDDILVNGNMSQYIRRLSEEQKQPILKWFRNRFKDRV